MKSYQINHLRSLYLKYSADTTSYEPIFNIQKSERIGCEKQVVIASVSDHITRPSH